MSRGLAWLAGLLGTGLLAGPAQAYVRSTTQNGLPTAWGSANLEVEIYTAEAPDFVTPAIVRQAVTEATAVWAKPVLACTDLSFVVSEVPQAFAPAEYDRRNRISFRRGSSREDWRKIPCTPTAKQSCSPYPTGAIAITTVTSNSNTGQILDADMELNAVFQKFAELGPDGSLRPDMAKVHDLQNTLTHEIGHLLGFDHNCYDPAANLRGPPTDNQGLPAPQCGEMSPPDIRAATMYYSAIDREVAKRTLESDDVLAVCEVYPVGYRSSFPGSEDDQGGCSLARTPARRPSPPLTLSLFLLGTLAAFRVSRRRRW